MELLVFSLFAAALLVCVIFHISLLFALLLGYVIFALYAIRKGFSLPEVLGMSAQGVRAAKNILTTFVLIGILTSLWRAGGTNPAIVCYYVRVMEPRLFLGCSFLLNCLVSFLTGTAFGSAATMGAVCMTMAAALGAGVDITQPEGHMVVDIGGGTTDVAVTALGGVVASACLSTAGDQFDEALMQYIRQKHSLLIGARTAEEVKEAIGRVDGPGEETLAVKGRCLNTGLPREILLSGEETAEAFTPVAENIISAVQAVLERTPPELAADVAVSGILLTGGGSLLQGMDTLLAARTGMETHLAEDPIRAVALGLEQTLPHLAKRQEGVLNLARRRQLTV